jgi:hypothetical protein
MGIGWNFPLNNDGAEVGLNDAGIETFRGNPIEALAREINQNSCDARKDEELPVEVHFTLQRVPTNKFPRKDSYIGILQSCLDYWGHIEKPRKFFENAINILENDYMNVLKISDYNTIGLTGAKLDRGGNWNSLIKAIGVSNKGSNAGGSFGIGKHAPFACSSLRTVFYGTRDEEGVFAFQGVGKLATHLKGTEATQGSGYFGIVEKNKPICDEYSGIDDFFQREQVGTDIFVMGFNGDEDNWETSIIKSVLESFFYSIHEGRLVVKVEDKIISTDTLAALLDEYTKEDPECLSYQYYQAILHGKKFETKIKGSDDIELYLLEGKNFPKKVAMVRGTGMKIFDKGHFRGLSKFAGVMIAKGEKINKLLRSIEPPSHDSWQPDRHEEDVKFAKKILKELNNWINENVRGLSELGNVEELDVEGISQYLPDDEENNPLDNSDKEKEDYATIPKEVKIEKVATNKQFDAKTVTAVGEVNTGNEDDETEVPDPKNDENNNKGGLSATKKDKGGRENSDGKGINPDGDVFEPTGNENTKPPLELKAFRAACVNPKEGMYRISYTPSRSGTGFLIVNIAGEQGKEAVAVRSAVMPDNSQISIKLKNQIGPINFKDNNRETITLFLEEKIRCALGVVMYES